MLEFNKFSSRYNLDKNEELQIQNIGTFK